jgi:hypothetical protein
MLRKIVLLFSLISFFMASQLPAEKIGMDPEKTINVILIGASVGKSWNLPQLPQRVGNNNYTFENIAVYSHDKTETLQKVLLRDKKPNIIILKECAAFFPGNEEKLKPLVKQWVKMCRKNDVVPVLATVVPVVKSYPLRMFLLNLMHLKFWWPKGTFDALISYNDWIHKYSREENIEVIDLEAALRTGPDDRYLKSSFAEKDGLHINRLAYKELDKAIFPVLDKTGTDQ